MYITQAIYLFQIYRKFKDSTERAHVTCPQLPLLQHLTSADVFVKTEVNTTAVP